MSKNERLEKARQMTMLTLLMLWTGMSQAQGIKFETLLHDFGKIEESKGDVYYDFKFTNTCSSNITIREVITGCGCTAAQWSNEAYQPGQEGVIRVTYHPEGRTAEEFSIPTEVFTSSRKPQILTIKGKVNLTHHTDINFFTPEKGEKAKYRAKRPKDEYEIILERRRQQLLKNNNIKSIHENAEKLMRQLTPEGTWAGIDYQCTFRTYWEPSEHLNRIIALAFGYTHPKSKLYGNSQLYMAICKAAEKWNEYKPKSCNWYHNEIPVPQRMADILTLMDAGISKLPKATVEGFMDMMKDNDPRKWTGANNMDIAFHHLLRGCVMKNDSVVSTTVDEFFQPLRISKDEGIRADMAYHQHGKQLYIGGYGYVFLENVSKVAPLLTVHALPSAKKSSICSVRS